MFKIADSTHYYYPVTIEQTDENGRYAKQVFDAKFARLEQSELDLLMERIQSGEMSDGDVARRVFIGWRDVRSPSGDEYPYTEDNRENLLNTFPVQPSVVRAWFESLKVGKRKN
jgi:hypothetical protein